MPANSIKCVDAREGMADMPPCSVDMSFWSPPYFVGKDYESDWTFADWQSLIRGVLLKHPRVVKPGGFVIVNIADILCFADNGMPRFQADNVRGKRCRVTKNDVLAMKKARPEANRRELAAALGCSEQTVQRRMEGNNIRGGKQSPPTKVKLTGDIIVGLAEDAGMFLYDQRIWHKDPCWANSQWHSNSYRAVDEFERLLVFWVPGPTTYDRSRLTPNEWGEWGSRGVWNIPSVRRNGCRHECEFPELLAERVVRLYSSRGDTVLDPFVGSGTTAVVAKRLGRGWVGFDLDARFVKTARRRVADTQAPSP